MSDLRAGMFFHRVLFFGILVIGQISSVPSLCFALIDCCQCRCGGYCDPVCSRGSIGECKPCSQITIQPTPTRTPTRAPATATPTPLRPTSTPTIAKSTATPTNTPRSTATPTPWPTVTPTRRATTTPTRVPTSTPFQWPTSTPTVFVTPSRTPTATQTFPWNVPTNTPTNSPRATRTPTPTPIIEVTLEPTSTPTQTPSPMPTSTPTVTSTASPTHTPSVTPTETPTELPTFTPTPESPCWVSGQTFVDSSLSSASDLAALMWHPRKPDVVCLAMRAPGCLPAISGDDCYKYEEFRAGAGCGGVEARLSCQKRPLFADPRTDQMSAGLVQAD